MKEENNGLQVFKDQLPGNAISSTRYAGMPEDDMKVRDYAQIFMKRKWTFIGTFVGVLAVVAAITFMMTPVYRASVMIKIDKENPNVLDSMKEAMGQTGDDYYQTQYKVLKSRSLAKKVIHEMGLENIPEFKSHYKQGLQSTALVTAKVDTQDPAAADSYNNINKGIVDYFIDRLNVEPMQKSRLVAVSFDSQDPVLATAIADKIGKAFIEFNTERKFDMTSQSKHWLDAQQKEMKAKMEASTKDLNDYMAKNHIVFIGSEAKSSNEKGVSTGTSSSSSGNYSIVTSKLAQLSTSLVTATSDRIAKEALYREIKGSETTNGAVLGNQLVQKLKESLASAESDYTQLSKQYKPNHPKMVKLNEQITAMRSKVSDETNRTVASIKNDYDTAISKERQLAAALETQKTEALNLNEKMLGYEVLKGDVETNRALYGTLMVKAKEAEIATSLTSSNIQVLDIAEMPVKQHRPSYPINFGIGFILAFFGGIGLVFTKEFMDNTIKTPEDVEKKMGLANLGLVPSFKSITEKPTTALIAHENKKGPLTEAYRSIGTYLKFSSAGRAPQVMVVTSAKPSEGKTTTSVNTAISMSHSAGRGIIIDADMRKPQIHKVFGLNSKKGLSSYLSGDCTIEDEKFIQRSQVPNLDVITAGIIPPNPSELLSSMLMKDLIAELSKTYAFIIVDAPPVLGLSDSLMISTVADGVIMVLKSGYTTKDEAKHATKLLTGVNAKVLGCVLNGVKQVDLKYGQYAYYSSYYYEDDKDSSNRRKIS